MRDISRHKVLSAQTIQDWEPCHARLMLNDFSKTSCLDNVREFCRLDWMGLTALCKSDG